MQWIERLSCRVRSRQTMIRGGVVAFLKVAESLAAGRISLPLPD